MCVICDARDRQRVKEKQNFITGGKTLLSYSIQDILYNYQEEHSVKMMRYHIQIKFKVKVQVKVFMPFLSCWINLL